MFKKYLLPIVSLAMLTFAILHAVRGQQAKPTLEPPTPAARAPFDRPIGASGVAEANTENIAVGSYVPGVVVEVFVKVGTEVKAGDRLFRLDERPLRAELAARKANLALAEQQLARLNAMPRPEEVPAPKARVRQAEENLVDVEDQLSRTEQLRPTAAASQDELIRRRQAVAVAREQLAQARADLALTVAGAWQADKDVTRATVEQMRAQVAQTETDLERLEVRALVDGQVLWVNVRPGEFVGAPPDKTLIVMGDVKPLHVRVDVDEHDIVRLRPEAPAVASVRGDAAHTFPLKFVRFEPLVQPKKSLTGDNTERVDTRVLQVIYALDKTADRQVFVGQQMDVFIQDLGR
jgi:multidrug resistance efflux pump